MSYDRVLVAPMAADPTVRAEILARARRRGFRRFVLEPSEPVPPGDIESYVREGSEYSLRDVSGVASGRSLREFRVADPRELASAVAHLNRERSVVVRWQGERILPLETLLAGRPESGEVWVVTRRTEELPGYLGALERGVDAVVVETENPDDVDELERALDRSIPLDLPWQEASVSEVASGGLGDRVLVDTTSLLAPDEGLLVGSAAAFLFHVASEAVGSRYTRPRPFRVNAGAAHLYVLGSDGTTRYLSELVPGDTVFVGKPNSGGRAVRVGRIKIERRPLVRVSARVGPATRSVFLQEAETVRLASAAGPMSTTDVHPGVSLWGVALPPARHLGMAISETVEER